MKFTITRRGLLWGLLLAALAALALGRRGETSMERGGLAMNTVVRISAVGPERGALSAALDEAFALLASLDGELSLYSEGSALSRINRAAGGAVPVPVPTDVFAAVSRAAEAHALTAGVFNPLIGPITKIWKINQAPDDRRACALPSQASLDQALRLTDMAGLELFPEGEGGPALRLARPGATLDLGGIAKGCASSRIAALLGERGVKSALIDLGGNIQVMGPGPGGEAWHIGVRDPLAPEGETLLTLTVEDAAVVTSGGYERYKVIDGVRYSHFFDPRTGRPARNDMLSATLVTPDGPLADARATAFMIRGSERAMELLRARRDLRAVLVRRRGGGAVEDGLTPEDIEILATENLRGNVQSRRQVQYF